MKPILGDREVEKRGMHLDGRQIDFLVSGGVGAIESPRIIRELRRYGADVRVILSRSASDFVSPLVFEWAAAQSVVTQLSGQAEHISQADAIVVSPATLNFMAKLALGLADCPASTRAHSVLGRKPVFIQPSMHHSLLESPAYAEHRQKLERLPQVYFLEPKWDESKAKSAEPEALVAEVSHQLNRRSQAALVLAGPTRSPMDAVRYVSNRSTGQLGLRIADEFYRSGYDVEMILGPTEVSLPRFLNVARVETATEMREVALRKISEKDFEVRIFSAAVLDFEVIEARRGKQKSDVESWDVSLRRSPKLIDELVDPKALNVGFKLESEVSDSDLFGQMKALQQRTGCQWVVGNLLESVSEQKHAAYLMGPEGEPIGLEGKGHIAQQLLKQLDQNKNKQ